MNGYIASCHLGMERARRSSLSPVLGRILHQINVDYRPVWKSQNIHWFIEHATSAPKCLMIDYISMFYLFQMFSFI